ncbi:hypothetical protein ACER0C_003420 [Sarotherodon galilaeus]
MAAVSVVVTISSYNYHCAEEEQGPDLQSSLSHPNPPTPLSSVLLHLLSLPSFHLYFTLWFYKDVSIRDDAELCDPTLPDEDEEDDDDENMNEDDYDEADLMEIDSCEKNALSEAQNKNEQNIDMLPCDVLDNTTPESSNVWMTSLNDKYKARPETPEYEEMCMADFAATCRIVYGQQTKDHELKTPSLPTYQAFYGAGCVQLPGTDRLEYVQHIVKRNREKYEKNSEEIESAVEEYEQNRGMTDEWCNLAPESDLVRLPLVEQERERDNENEQEDVPDYSRQADASTEVRAIREPPAIDPTLLHARLKQIKGTRRPFGGMSVIAVGDFYQLPPVRQSKPLCVHDPSEIDLWREHFQMITLTEIMRQKDDVVFAEMLNRIRVKGKLDELCEADRNLLSQAITEPALCPTDALHIFATNKEVDAHNSATLALLHTHIIDIHADDYRKDPRTGRMALQDRPLKGGKNELPDTLKVAEGARVMLTRNIDIQNGLVNGAFGILLRVVYSENDHHIIKLGLKMDIETSGKNNRTPADNMVYIERAEENLKQKGVVRRQFPVKMAFACTIHKVQGMTTTSAVVSLKSIFEPGMAYVAVSRVTSLSGLYLLDMEEKKIFTNPEITAALENMRQANLDDMMPLLHVEAPVSALIAVVYRPPDYTLRPFLKNLRDTVLCLLQASHVKSNSVKHIAARNCNATDQRGFIITIFIAVRSESSDTETFGAELSLLDLLRPAGMPFSLRSLSLDESDIVSVREDNVSEEDDLEISPSLLNKTVSE